MTATRCLSLFAAFVLMLASPTAGDTLVRPGLHPLLVTFTPPDYVGGEPMFSEEPASVRGIEGGTILIRGRGDLEDVTALMGGDTVFAEPDEIGFRIVLEMPAEGVEVYVADGMEDHNITLDPVRDSLPVVTLLEPQRDSVGSARGKVHLVAQVSDDHGVTEAWFELTQARTGRVGKLSGPNRGSPQRLDAFLNLDSLKLKPGDVLGLRAVARDLGPAARGLGVSEIRTFRVAP